MTSTESATLRQCDRKKAHVILMPLLLQFDLVDVVVTSSSSAAATIRTTAFGIGSTAVFVLLSLFFSFLRCVKITNEKTNSQSRSVSHLPTATEYKSKPPSSSFFLSVWNLSNNKTRRNDEEKMKNPVPTNHKTVHCTRRCVDG